MVSPRGDGRRMPVLSIVTRWPPRHIGRGVPRSPGRWDYAGAARAVLSAEPPDGLPLLGWGRGVPAHGRRVVVARAGRRRSAAPGLARLGACRRARGHRSARGSAQRPCDLAAGGHGGGDGFGACAAVATYAPAGGGGGRLR